MSRKIPAALLLLALGVSGAIAWYGIRAVRSTARVVATAPVPAEEGSPLARRFASDVKPFLDRYCVSCHGAGKKEADLDLSRDVTFESVEKNVRQWELVLGRLEAGEMPPEEAPALPTPAEREAVVAWLRDLRERERSRTAGDPGPVLARRLSNAEFDNTIRDLTGVDIRPTREFPVDPANEAGFDNSGESLSMSPARLEKYFAAARLVADHVVLKPSGFVFAPHAVATDTDRDKYCVRRIVDFYRRHPVDLADYFLAASNYRHRTRPEAPLDRFATEKGLSPKYLAAVWSALNGPDATEGPMAVVQKLWRDLPAGDAARPGCERLRDVVLRLRRQLEPNIPKVSVKGISNGSQTLILWANRRRAGGRRSYTGDLASDWRKLAAQVKADASLAKLFPERAESEEGRRATLARFCEAFPSSFVVTNQTRPLTAGFHLMQGYFRDDAPLCDLILDESQRRELDALWDELNFVTGAPMRQYKDFIFFERAEPPRYMREAEFDFARSEDKDVTSADKMARLARAYLAKAVKQGAKGDAVEAIETYFATLSAEIRRVERARVAAEPSHLEALARFAERAYRRPLTAPEREGLLSFYRALRKDDGLGHEDAVRDTLASVLLSTHFCYRIDLAPPGAAPGPVSDHALASRLSYFLWASMPDAELMAHADAGDLHEPATLKAQTRRMLADPRVRGLATEFAGNWLDFRRFEEHNGVDRARFPAFTNELRRAMFEEPVRYFMDIARRDRSVLDLLHGKDTFVNAPLAKHYGMPEPPRGEEWAHVADADRYGRGGVLPMAVFLTRNAPGLRTSPVKRGYWVVRRVLGERIPPPPPTVAELPKDEAKLGDLTLPQLLARHRDDRACAGCHRRFDAVGLAFEGFGPVGERRSLDLGGRPVQIRASFPDGKDREGVEGLRAYLRDQRRGDYIDNLCKKLFSYALGRSLQLSDARAIDAMKARMAAEGYAFGSLVEQIVASPQFLNKRGQDDPRER